MTKPINLKKRLSVDLAKVIEKPLRNYYGLFKIEENKDNFLLYLRDADNNSDLYFGIIKETSDSSAHNVHYSCKPFDSSLKGNHANIAKLNNFDTLLTKWLENIKFYEEESILNDPLIRGYQNEFYSDFKIVDADADLTGFNYSQQLQLEVFFENIIENIDEIKDEKNAEFIEEIKEEIKSLQECVSRETKNGLMNKFSFLLAKTRKGSSKACQYILKEFAKEFIKGGAKLAFNYVVKNADKLPEYIQHISQLISI